MANSFYQKKATIDAVNAKKPEALRRDEDTDYTEGYFFVTLNVLDSKAVLGSVTGYVDRTTGTAVNAGVELFEMGEKVQACWQNLPDYHPNVQVIDSVVMPEHFHGLLHLDHTDGVTLGLVIKGFKIGCNRAYKEVSGMSSAVLFSRGYNETTPITPEEVATKIAYIRSNPERRIIKGQMRNCFTIYRNQHSANWTLTRAKSGLLRDYAMARDPQKLEEGWQAILPRLAHIPTSSAQPSGVPPIDPQLSLTYIGKRDILLHSRLLPLVCHRVDEPRREEHIAAVLREARNGAVIVSAFISKRERDIRDLLLQEGCPIVEIFDNGMSSKYKPYGKAFYYSAEGRLLQITPWTYLYQKNALVSRPMCMVMNELARLIAGKDDDWWKG